MPELEHRPMEPRGEVDFPGEHNRRGRGAAGVKERKAQGWLIRGREGIEGDGRWREERIKLIDLNRICG